MTSCPHTGRVDAHFAGTLPAGDETEMRRHLLEGCPACRQRYTRHSMLARLTPGAPKAEDRLARALGFSPRRRSPRWLAFFGVVAACGALALVIGRDRDGFQSRGKPDAGAELRVYRVRPGAKSEPVAGQFAATDELAFAYRQGAGPRYLYIFGVDEHRHVYWFSPAWKSAGMEPAALVVPGDNQLHEVPDAIGHAYDGKRLEVRALFCDRAWRLPEVEARVTGKEPSFPECAAVLQRFEVR